MYIKVSNPSVIPVLGPEDEPPHKNEKDDFEEKHHEAEWDALVVAELRIKIIHDSIGSPLCDLLEENLAAIMHGRDPADKFDDRVGSLTCIGHATSAKV